MENMIDWFSCVLDEIHESWHPCFSSPKMTAELKDINRRLNKALRDGLIIYPKRENVFRLFKLVPLDKIKCVIIGQDPYHSGDATGIAFSGGRKGNIPASLANIWKEVCRCYPAKKLDSLESPNIEGWCEQGVFLLNRALTVVEQSPGSHLGIWSGVISLVMNEIMQYNTNIPWLLWGSKAKELKYTLEANQCTRILECAHPSPLSVKGYINNGHFLLVNNYLAEDGAEEIDWSRTLPTP
jgi:uracil-DNA glycosylase